SDTNRDRAYALLRARFSSWEEVAAAPVEEVEDAIRPGGLAPTKAPRIQSALRELDGDDLSWLAAADPREAVAYLTALPGVGRKTAACVMIFSFDVPEIPVDTHVHRVGARLGLFRPEAPLLEAHDEMLRVVDDADAYELHVNLIRHGRRLCRPRPRCEECELRRMCPWYRGREPRPAG
ncbi:MAG: DNA lyase, partial [Solirubrobacterales bacterium]|nr:DNA lyase [Solirubrobacterales bacterium]